MALMALVVFQVIWHQVIVASGIRQSGMRHRGRTASPGLIEHDCWAMFPRIELCFEGFEGNLNIKHLT